MGRGLIVWIIIMLLETIHGILRGLFLVPQVGEVMASRIGWPIGMAIVLGVSTLMVHWTGLRDRQALLRLGGIWTVLTFFFEVGIGLARGLDGPRILAEIDPLSGGLMIYSLLVMLAAPLIAARLRRL